ncbi:MAG: tetratricopeptide repeat protein [Myxococcota bacterium]
MSRIRHRSRRAALLLLLGSWAGALAACGGARGILNEQDPFAWATLRPDQWIEVRDGPLTIYSNAPPARVRELVADLSLLRAVVARLTDLITANERPSARVFVFASPLGFRHFQPTPTTAAYFVSLPQGSTIVTTAGLPGSARVRNRVMWMSGFSQEEALQRLYHEYVHLSLRGVRPLIYPPWYDEGIAELFSTVRLRDGVVQVGAVPSRPNPLPLSATDLLTVRAYQDFSAERIDSFYAQSRGLVHMLVGGHRIGLPDRRAALTRYLELVNEGVAEREACRLAFGVEPDRLGEELAAFLEGERVPQWHLDPSLLETTTADAERRLSIGESLALLGELAAEVLGIESETAGRLLRAAAERDPENATVLAWLALRSGVDGRLAETGDYLARVEAAGGGPGADRVVARLLLHRATESGATESGARGALVERALLRLRRSLEAEPGSIESLALLGNAYVLSDRDPTPGIEALERVRVAVPSSTAVHLVLAELYRRAGRWEPARESVDRVLQWSGSPAELDAARTLSAAIAVRSSGPLPAVR